MVIEHRHRRQGASKNQASLPYREFAASLLKRTPIVLIILAGFAYAEIAWPATALSDTQLADVSSGGIDPVVAGQSLPQDQQQPQTDDAISPVPVKPLDQDGLELSPALFAVAQSEIIMNRTRLLSLDGSAQQDTMLFNLENALSSDLVSTNNILDGSSITPYDVTSEIEIYQQNDLSQLHRTQGQLTSAQVGYRFERSESYRSGFESFEHLNYALIDQKRIVEYRDITISGVGVDIPGKLHESTQDLLNAELINDLQKLVLDVLQFDLRLNLGVGADFQGSGSFDSNPGNFYLEAGAYIDFCFIWCIKDIKVGEFTQNIALDIMDSNVPSPPDNVITFVLVDHEDDGVIADYDASDVSTSAYLESFEHTTLTGGQMTAAAAELLALSDSKLSVNDSSIVSLGDSSQRNMRIFNGINAVSSITANAMNISLLPQLGANSTALSKMSMRQHNLFDQQH
jgi:hypothetical protein